MVLIKVTPNVVNSIVFKLPCSLLGKVSKPDIYSRNKCFSVINHRCKQSRWSLAPCLKSVTYGPMVFGQNAYIQSLFISVHRNLNNEDQSFMFNSSARSTLQPTFYDQSSFQTSILEFDK